MVVGFYVTLLIFYFSFKVPHPRWLLVCGCFWVLFGWVIPDLQAHRKAQNRQHLVMTVLDVGHGGCVLLELPMGKNVLYDCGRYGSAKGAESAASALLWEKRIHKLDAVFVSHADADHYNGLPGLAKKFRIERVIISKNLERRLAQTPRFQEAMLGTEQKGVLRESVSQGDFMDFDSSVKFRILNPPNHAITNSDNEDSVAIEIQFQDVRILLPGDLEGPALNRLLNTKPSKYDIAMAPHHGSRNSDPDRFIEWCRAEILIVSAGRGKNTEIINTTDRYPYTTIFHTSYTGAVQIEIQDHGFQVETWHDRQGESPVRSARLPASDIRDYE